MVVRLDLSAQKEVGCSMKPALGDDLALGLLLVAVWDYKLKIKAILHLDQGSQGGFSRSSQRRIVEQVLDSYSETQRVFFNRVFSGTYVQGYGLDLLSIPMGQGGTFGEVLAQKIICIHICAVLRSATRGSE